MAEKFIDLENVRITLEYLHGDLKHAEGMQRVAAALAAAIREIDSVRTPTQGLLQRLLPVRERPRR
jgi:L-lysine 2,3-aminomutase